MGQKNVGCSTAPLTERLVTIERHDQYPLTMRGRKSPISGICFVP